MPFNKRTKGSCQNCYAFTILPFYGTTFSASVVSLPPPHAEDVYLSTVLGIVFVLLLSGISLAPTLTNDPRISFKCISP